MNFLNFFNNPNIETIGAMELTDIKSVATAFKSMASAMGMTNPSLSTSTSTKGVVIKRKGKKYLITFNRYNPPLVFTWTGSINDENLPEVLKKILERHKIIAALNTLKLSDGKIFHQLALAI